MTRAGALQQPTTSEAELRTSLSTVSPRARLYLTRSIRYLRPLIRPSRSRWSATRMMSLETAT
jgi:hypothetical protein